MATLVQSKQISKLLSANLYASSFTFPAAASSNVTAALTTAAATAGNGNVAVPVQVATPTTEGFITAAGKNRAEVYAAGITQVLSTGDTDGTTGVVTNVLPNTTAIVVGMVLNAAIAGIPAGSLVTAKTPTTVTFNAVSTSAVVAASFTVQTVPGEQKLKDAYDNEVYGRLTQAAGVYTLSLYSIISGIETSYVPALAVVIDFVTSYKYSFEHLPEDALVGSSIRHVGDDPVAGAQRTKDELVTVTAINVLALLSTSYVVGGFVTLTVNGQVIDRFGGVAAAFTVVGTTITWSAVNAGFSLVPGDRVVAEYAY
jgi:hypothetical protein